MPFDSPINQSGLLFYNTLFDENACCHLALGMGEVKHSSVGMLGLKKMPWRLVSPPPQNCPSGMRPTVRSVRCV